MDYKVDPGIKLSGQTFTIRDSRFVTAGPSMVWEYDCPCGETHLIAKAHVSGLACGNTGNALADADRHRLRPTVRHTPKAANPAPPTTF